CLVTLLDWRSLRCWQTVTTTRPRISTTCSSCNSTTIQQLRTPPSCRLLVSHTMDWPELTALSSRIRVFQGWTPSQDPGFGKTAGQHMKTSLNTLKAKFIIPRRNGSWIETDILESLSWLFVQYWIRSSLNPRPSNFNEIVAIVNNRAAHRIHDERLKCMRYNKDNRHFISAGLSALRDGRLIIKERAGGWGVARTQHQ
ncbi:hypothetical protein L9F63_018788, partial [Diploptera punctata]